MSLSPSEDKSSSQTFLEKMNHRACSIFRRVVEKYLETGDPVGSNTISDYLSVNLSAASVRHVMAQLENMGLLTSPHTSAGRVPTEAGLRLFVDGFLQVGSLTQEESRRIEKSAELSSNSPEGLFGEVTKTLSGLSHCTGLVLTPVVESSLKHLEFKLLSPTKMLVILVTEQGDVQNKLVNLASPVMPSSLLKVSNYLNSRFCGLTLSEMCTTMVAELKQLRHVLDALTAEVVAQGLVSWSEDTVLARKKDILERTLIVKGHSKLFNDIKAQKDLERVRQLFDELEEKEVFMEIMNSTQKGDGVSIFIGSETRLFSLTQCSMVVSSYSGAEGKIVGAIGIIGPKRLNYARIVPMVDYAADFIGRSLL